MNKCGVKLSYHATILCYMMFGGYWGISFFEGYISGAFGSLSRYYIFGLILFILFTAKKITVNGYQIVLSIWTVYYFASLLWSPNPEQGQVYLYSVIGMLVFLILILGIRFEDKFVDWCMEMTALCSLLLGILGVFYSSPYYGWIQSRRVLTLWGIQIDPNNLISLYAYGAGLGLYFLFFDEAKSFLKRILYGVAACINIYDILMCGSRSGIIVLLAIFCIILMNHPENNGKGKIIARRILFAFILMMAIILLISYLPEEVRMRILGQDKNLTFTDSTGRTERWKQGVLLWWNTNPIFGCGWGAFECHGTFFTFLVDTGLIGVLLFGGSIVGIIWNCVWNKRVQALLIIAAGLIPAFMIGAQNRRFFWNAIILPVMVMNQWKGEDNESVKNDCKNQDENQNII